MLRNEYENRKNTTKERRNINTIDTVDINKIQNNLRKNINSGITPASISENTKIEVQKI